ncbi:MAG: hypothetical protein K6E47_09815 [Lachnospiraceae bacterium]|nr:hypothetical protein [Lachnospiraceae bacterium]
MIIQHNLLAGNAKRQSNTSGARRKKATERLSSGYRINRAADDAAGLSISEKMRGQIRGLTRAAQNVQDGISFVQTGDGALEEVQSMLQRIRELAVQASNDTNTDDDRKSINKEVQQLKEEMKRVFNDAEYNSIKIFRAPYVPDVAGTPSDYELFNAADGISAAGVIINNKRFNWEELGAPTEPQSTDWEKQFTDDNGELIYLKLKAGASPSEISRIYKFEADNTGIKINNLYAGKWDDSISYSGNTYSFSYHGMYISFEVDPEDTREEIINKLNLDGISTDGPSYNNWEVLPSGGAKTSAVRISGDSMTFDVTNENKGLIGAWSYRLVADDTGVGLVQTVGNDGMNHTKTRWEDFTNVNSGEAFPIADWGTEAEGANPVTLASSSKGAAYRYTDSANADYQTDGLTVGFSFPLDETSKEQVIAELSNDLKAGSVHAPIASVTVSDNNVTVRGYEHLDWHEFQAAQLLRDYDTDDPDYSMDITVYRTFQDYRKVDDYENRRDLLEAYVKQESTTTTYTVTHFGELQSAVFLDENSNPLSGEFTYDSITVPDDEIVEGETNTSSIYLANKGFSSSYSTQSDNMGEYTDAGTRTVTETFSYQDGDETKTGYVQLTYAISQATRTVISNVLEKDSNGAIVNYASSGDGYRIVNGSDYYVLTSDESAEKDTENRSFRAAEETDTDTQRYISDTKRWVVARTYDLCNYQCAAYNSADRCIMGYLSPEFIKTGSSDTSIIIHDYKGQAKSYRTENEPVVDLVLLGGINGYNAELRLKFDNKLESSNCVVSIKPDGKATRTFSLADKSGGIATNTNLTVKVNPPQKTLHIQAGANEGQSIDIKWPGLSNSIIGISGARFDTAETAQATITMADNSIAMVSEVRSKFGAYQNRLEHAYSVDQNTAENTQAAESRIRDTDMAKEMMEYAKSDILNNAAQAMIAQANRQPEGILKILS